MFKRTSQKGFTLIEMVVAIGLFVVVALVAIGALLKIIDANKKSQSIKTALTNMNFVLDSMTREMRVGGNYKCVSGAKVTDTVLNSAVACDDPPITSGSWTIAFNSSKTKTKVSDGTKCRLIRAYYYDAANSSLEKGEQVECGDPITYYPLIYGATTVSDRINDAAIKFEQGNIKVVTALGKQPYAQFHFAGYSGVKAKLKSYFDIQTTVSQRLPD